MIREVYERPWVYILKLFVLLVFTEKWKYENYTSRKDDKNVKYFGLILTRRPQNSWNYKTALENAKHKKGTQAPFIINKTPTQFRIYLIDKSTTGNHSK